MSEIDVDVAEFTQGEAEAEFEFLTLAAALKGADEDLLTAAEQIYLAGKTPDTSLEEIRAELERSGVYKSKATLSKLAKTWQAWVVRGGIPKGDLAGLEWTKLYLVGSFLARNPFQNARQWLEHVRDCTTGELRDLMGRTTDDPPEPKSLPRSIWQRIDGLKTRILEVAGVAISTAEAVEKALAALEDMTNEELLRWWKDIHGEAENEPEPGPAQDAEDEAREEIDEDDLDLGVLDEEFFGWLSEVMAFDNVITPKKLRQAVEEGPQSEVIGTLHGLLVTEGYSPPHEWIHSAVERYVREFLQGVGS